MQNNLQLPKLSTGIIFIKDNKILLAKRKSELGKNTWGSCGGHIEIGETPKQAAIREAREELGIEAGNLKFLYSAFKLYDQQCYLDTVFTGDIISGELKNAEPDKKEGLGWYDLNNLPGELFFPVILALESIKTGEKYYE